MGYNGIKQFVWLCIHTVFTTFVTCFFIWKFIPMDLILIPIPFESENARTIFQISVFISIMYYELKRQERMVRACIYTVNTTAESLPIST